MQKYIKNDNLASEFQSTALSQLSMSKKLQRDIVVDNLHSHE